LPLNYLETFTQVINDTTREQVVDAFQRRINLDKLLTVIVGGEEAETNGVEDSDKKESTN